MAVAFSGGLDSSVIAACARRHTSVVACTASSPGSWDSARAKEAAEALGVELTETTLTSETVGEAERALELPFEPTLMDRSLWCLYYAVARTASRSGAKVMLLGQLADELFGGYSKYSEALHSKGEDAAAAMMRADARDYALRGRVRDLRACQKWVEPRLPFEDAGVAELAASLPVSFKVRGGVRKAVLRRAASLMGLPENVAGAPKKAAQYSSGVQKLLSGSRF